MKRMKKLARHEGGAAIIEFALAAPVLFTMIFGIAQLGIVLSANAGLQHAVAEGARAAAEYRPAGEQITAEEIRAVITDSRFSLDPGLLPEATVVDGEDAAGRPYFDIGLSYEVPLNFVFVSPSVTISESRRVYTQEDTPAVGGGSSSAGGSSTGGEEAGSSAGTTTGGDAGTTTGGDAGTSSGTDTTSTSTGASTTSSTTTSTSGGSGNGHGNGNGSSGNGNGSSGNGNGSSGNGNGNGNGN